MKVVHKIVNFLPLILAYEAKTNLPRTADKLDIHHAGTPIDTPLACYFYPFQFYGNNLTVQS